MDEWLDSLSEDWISQPRSNSLPNTSPLPGNSSHDSNASQSRIPRYNPRSVSNTVGSGATQSERRSSSTTDPKKKAALSERSLSNINASQSSGWKGPVNTGSSAAEAFPKSRRQASTTSLPSMRQDTVQHNPSRPSPLKISSPQATPEWKRRVLQGNIAPGDQCDLFSPISLEKVFRPPTLAPKKKPRQSTKPRLPLDEFPSSPSSFPSSVIKAPKTGSRNPEPHQPSALPSTDTQAGGSRNSETASDKAGSIRVKGQGKSNAKSRSEAVNSSTPTRSLHSTHNVSQRGPSQLRGSKAQSSPSKAVLSSELLSPRTESGTANCHELPAPIEESRNISTQSEDRDEKISPIYVTRDHSGSPLKLFDKYDTFTNDRLCRRMSKFEEAMHNDIDEENSEHVNGDDDSIVSEHSTSRQGQHPQKQGKNTHHSSNARISSFGEGELNDHVFKTYNSSISYPAPEAGENTDGPGSTAESNAGAFKFNKWPKPDSQLHDSTKGTLSGSSPHLPSQGLNRGREDHAEEPSLSAKFRSPSNGKNKAQKEDLRNAQGKRLPRSPAKNPQRKRRRTLRSSDEVDQDRPRAETVPETKVPAVKSVVGRKRKDALYDVQSQAADPKILAMRQILRPRSSTNSSQGRSVPEGRAIGPEDKIPQTPATLESGPIQSLNLDRPTKQLAEELATFTLDMVQDITYGSRKASVTTADFFNEAQQIMQLIRAQGRPQSNHEIVEESEAENRAEQESYAEESTKEEFSRPPSRDGANLRRSREPALVDPRIISHLRKFEDKDDFAITLSSSLKSLQIRQSSEGFLDENRNPQGHGNNLESEPPNLRILSQNVQLDRGKCSSSMADLPALDTDTKVHSTSSHSTSGPSTGRSLHTVSSRGSGNKVVIAPETVSHLLSDQIAGMTFDHDRQIWVKRKAVSKTGDLEMPNCASSEMTDEDLFGEIPDLSVDELEEMQRIKDAANSLKRMGSESDGISNHDYAKPIKTRDVEFHPSDEYQDHRPRTAEGAVLLANDDSSAPSKYSRFASSGHVAETRATSWGDDLLPLKGTGMASENSPKSSVDYDEHEEEVEHEISILEGRQSRTPTRSNHRDRQARVVTVAFSSPLIDQMTPIASNGGMETWEEESDLDLEDSPVRFDSRPEVSSLRKPSGHAGRRSSYRSASRRRSLGSQSYVARPMSRLDERDEISFLQSNGTSNTRLDMVISTPLSFQQSMIAPHGPSTGQRSSVGFHLSPLADFTVHQTDSPSSGRRDLADRCGLLPLHEVQSRFSLATQDLVKQLTDLEPFEPYWDFIRSIDLQKRGLVTLHALGDFCRRIEELDVSDNTLDQLHGAPSSIRDLKICRNQLSDLTAWGHLQNLQFLDVSHNQIRSLKGFQRLVHLRELKADGNLIESLDGIFEHDGMIRLSLRGNLVKSIDFEGSTLKRLTHLDMHGNQLAKVSNTHFLAALEYLDLSDNQLEDSSPPSSAPLLALEVFNISRNRIRTIDVTQMPNLRTLNMDKNSISHIQGLNHVKRLESLFWREQSLITGSSFAEIQYQDCHNVQNLFLSNNVLSSFAPSTRFLNLRNLELASTGLISLPTDFGYKLPNLQILNLNYNALRDLRPLLGIASLRNLFAAGNRISRLRQTATVLEHLGEDLVEVDVRRNPLTVGFYTPQDSTSAPEQQIAVQDHNQVRESRAEERAEVGHTKAYLLPLVNRETDTLSRARLDEDTKLRRRVYDMLMVSECAGLALLDGMEVDRSGVKRRDGVWERLMELGILGEREAVNMEVEERGGSGKRRKERVKAV